MPFSDLFEDSSRVSGFCKKYKKHFIGISVTFVILVIIATAIGLTSGLKGKLTLNWRFLDGERAEGTIDIGVPTQIGNKIYTNNTDHSHIQNGTLTRFPDYISGSYHYQLKTYVYDERLQLTFHAKSTCEVYIASDERNWDFKMIGYFLLDNNFTKKNEVVGISDGVHQYTLALYHKHFLIDEKLILTLNDSDEVYGDKLFYGTIFVK